MTQIETIEKALGLITNEDFPDDPVEEALKGVLNATLDVKRWEAETGEGIECECDQCVATVRLAEVLIREIEEDEAAIAADRGEEK